MCAFLQLGILANFGLIAAGAFTRFVNQGIAKGNEMLSMQVRRCVVPRKAGRKKEGQLFVEFVEKGVAIPSCGTECALGEVLGRAQSARRGTLPSN